MKNEKPSKGSNSVKINAQVHKIEERAKTIPLVMQTKPQVQPKQGEKPKSDNSK